MPKVRGSPRALAAGSRTSAASASARRRAMSSVPSRKFVHDASAQWGMGVSVPGPVASARRRSGGPDSRGSVEGPRGWSKERGPGAETPIPPPDRREANFGLRTLARRSDVDLFDPPASATPSPAAPLADRMRPRTLDEVIGQSHLIGPGKVLRRSLEGGALHSMILWGPPGSGKTTLALLMAEVAGARFVTFSAVMSGVKEI